MRGGLFVIGAGAIIPGSVFLDKPDARGIMWPASAR
jgi:hypothetical protein